MCVGGSFLFDVQHRFVCDCLLGCGSENFQDGGADPAVLEGERDDVDEGRHSRGQ